jgi:hypothetical protein
LIFRIEQWTAKVAEVFNWVSAAAVAGMVVLTCMDIILRLFRHPIPGTYEMVGFLGAVFAAFALGYTSVNRGHIAVDFLVQKLPARAQSLRGRRQRPDLRRFFRISVPPVPGLRREPEIRRRSIHDAADAGLSLCLRHCGLGCLLLTLVLARAIT